MPQTVAAPWAVPVPEFSGRLLTAEELAILPDDSWRYELVEGRLVRMPPPGSRHGRVGMRLGSVLQAFVEGRGLGTAFAAETGFRLGAAGGPDTVLGADVAYVRADRLPPEESPAWSSYLRLAPDLIAEIASPNQYRPEMAQKAQRWLRAGVRLVWVIWPTRRQVDVWRAGRLTPVGTLSAGDELDGLDVVPGFTYPLATLFA